MVASTSAHAAASGIVAGGPAVGHAHGEGVVHPVRVDGGPNATLGLSAAEKAPPDGTADSFPR